jgi:hypothetical protein
MLDRIEATEPLQHEVKVGAHVLDRSTCASHF